ncbi:MAG: glycosyl hydrolase family 5 [Rhizobiales bacterium]|nr:glycosyl hydrolase family 5 [Hyphomicrobiales bacterium]
MLSRSSLTLSVVASAFLFAAPVSSASAAPASPSPGQSAAASQSVLVEPVQFRRHCRRWNRECRARWGFGWRYRRCMIRHGC